jgi:PEP-CTERM motif-containing protein
MLTPRVLIVLAAVTLSLVGNKAAADPITVSSGFLASGFGQGAPVDPVVGWFSVTFDNSLTLTDQTAGITLHLNIALDSAPAFGYGHLADVLVLGAIEQGAQTMGPGTNDFLFGLINVSTNPTVVDFAYSQVGYPVVFHASELALAPVPEPGTLVLCGTGALIAWRASRKNRRLSGCPPAAGPAA